MNIFTSLNLKCEPFSISPDPAFFYRSKSHQTALNRLEISIRLKRGLSLILGDVGTGKTTLSRALFHTFEGEDQRYIFHMILDPYFKSEYQFLAHLTKVFGISPFFRSSLDHREAIEKYLYRSCVEEGKTIILVIDEGQKLSLNHLEILRTFLNYETNKQKLLQVVLLAQLELLPRIKKVHNLMDRINLKYMINPLDEMETGEMIHFRLEQAGYSGERNLFSQDAIRRIFAYTLGYPRQISRICQNAVEVLIAEGWEAVTGDLIDKIIEQDKMWKEQ